MSAPYLDFSALTLRYRPFPIGIAKPIMSEEQYAQFVDAFPAVDLFDDYAYLGNPGAKLTLSEKENPKRYRAFVLSHPLWREFHHWVKSPQFPYYIIRVLAERHVDLGYRHLTPLQRALKVLTDGGINSFIRNPPLRSRFEFSILRGDGGHLPPHTDAPSKVATIIVSIARDGEWDPSWGGGTDIDEPRDDAHAFNQMNEVTGFETMNVLDTFAFEPNQAIVFVKTYNSWHAVRPITAGDGQTLRRTLTINIERCR
jgi:hypothetical protein